MYSILTGTSFKQNEQYTENIEQLYRMSSQDILSLKFYFKINDIIQDNQIAYFFNNKKIILLGDIFDTSNTPKDDVNNIFHLHRLFNLKNIMIDTQEHINHFKYVYEIITYKLIEYLKNILQNHFIAILGNHDVLNIINYDFIDRNLFINYYDDNDVKFSHNISTQDDMIKILNINNYKQIISLIEYGTNTTNHSYHIYGHTNNGFNSKRISIDIGMSRFKKHMIMEQLFKKCEYNKIIYYVLLIVNDNISDIEYKLFKNKQLYTTLKQSSHIEQFNILSQYLQKYSYLELFNINDDDILTNENWKILNKLLKIHKTIIENKLDKTTYNDLIKCYDDMIVRLDYCYIKYKFVDSSNCIIYYTTASKIKKDANNNIIVSYNPLVGHFKKDNLFFEQQTSVSDNILKNVNYGGERNLLLVKNKNHFEYIKK